MNRHRIHAAPAAAATLALIFALARPSSAAAGFELTLQPESASILSGTPLKFDVGFTNKSAEAATIHFRGDGREALAFSIRNAAGKEVAEGDYFKPRPGAYPPIAVPAGAAESRAAFLNRWISTRIAPGDYEVRGRARYFAGASKSPSEAIASFKITILPCEPGLAATQLEALREIAQAEPLAGGVTGGISAAVPIKLSEDEPGKAARRDARTRIAMADFEGAATYRSLILCACGECGAVDFDDVTLRIKSRQDSADIRMLADVVALGQCFSAGRAAARAALAEIYIASRDEALKRSIRPALDTRLEK